MYLRVGDREPPLVGISLSLTVNLDGSTVRLVPRPFNQSFCVQTLMLLPQLRPPQSTCKSVPENAILNLLYP